MWLSALVSAVHLLSLAAGVTLLFARERALRGPLDDAGIQRVLRYDNIAGVVAILWIGSGLWRAFGGLEKGTAFYLASRLFWVKVGLMSVVFALECWPMTTFIRWRVALAQGRAVVPRHLPWLRRVHFIELALLALTVCAASLMARGVGQPHQPETAAAQRGAVLYRERCLPCHQADGRGVNGRLAADLATRLAKPDAVLLRSIADGVPGTAMLGWRGRLAEEDMAALLSYLRATFTPRPPSP